LNNTSSHQGQEKILCVTMTLPISIPPLLFPLFTELGMRMTTPSSIRCLMITVRPPYPPHDGGAIRAFNVLKGLNRAFNLDVISLVPDNYDQKYLPQLKHHCQDFYSVHSNLSAINDLKNVALGLINGTPLTMARYNQPAMRNKITELTTKNHYDIVFFNNLHSTHYLDLFPDSLKIVDTQNNDITVFSRWASKQRNPTMKAFGYLQAHLAKRFLSRQLPLIDIVYACSDKEQKELKVFCPNSTVTTAPNGVDLEYFSFQNRQRDPNMLLFTGDMRWLPNEDGLEYFLKEILPLIKQQRPSTKVVLAGKHPSKALQRLGGENVEFTGFVEDLRDYMNKAAVFIVPLRIGGGTRLKVIEAMAMKIPMVSTSIGCEGIDCIDEEHLLIRDTPQNFADGVCQLLNNPGQSALLTEKGYTLAKSKYDWVAITEKMTQQLEDNFE
jgi:glycosyltransferase involved in cell wall biosynthesis